MVRKAVFLDRDGVINDLVPDPEDGRPEGPLNPQDVRVLAGVPDAVEQLKAVGYLVIAASNQPAAAKGKVSMEILREIHGRVAAEVALDDWRYCFHRAEDECACRKPKPGLLLDAMRDHDVDPAASWFVGDADTDVEAGRQAGVRTLLVGHPGSEHRRMGEADARNLPQAVAFILGDRYAR